VIAAFSLSELCHRSGYVSYAIKAFSRSLCLVRLQVNRPVALSSFTSIPPFIVAIVITPMLLTHLLILPSRRIYAHSYRSMPRSLPMHFRVHRQIVSEFVTEFPRRPMSSTLPSRCLDCVPRRLSRFLCLCIVPNVW
jgi:hypothetical protein